MHDTRASLPLWQTLALIALFAFGMIVFRMANYQKFSIKRDKNALIWGKPPKYIGGKLLISGCWGIGRKINYLGDLCNAFAFGLTCGTQSWLVCY